MPNLQDWKPQSPEATADDLPRLCALHCVVVLHCWAVWDRKHDQTMDNSLQTLRAEFADRVGVYALNVDDETNVEFLQRENLGNVPALFCFINNERKGFVGGVRDTAFLRDMFREWLTVAHGVNGSQP